LTCIKVNAPTSTYGGSKMNTTLSGLLTDVRPVPPGESILQANDRDTTLIEVVRPLLVDTRPIFARGDTPCKAIDEAVSSLIPGQLLVLVVDFEPVPLYAKLGNQGFSHTAKQLSDGAWRVEFQRKL